MRSINYVDQHNHQTYSTLINFMLTSSTYFVNQSKITGEKKNHTTIEYETCSQILVDASFVTRECYNIGHEVGNHTRENRKPFKG